VDFKFTEDEEYIQKIARDFAQKRILPKTEEIDKTDELPKEIWDGLCELGIPGMVLPDEFGGGETGYESYVLALEQIARASAGVGTALAVHVTSSEAIQFFGTQEQKEKYLPDLAEGEVKGSFAFTEPGTGSDPKQLTTTAIRQGDYFIINGVKRFITNSGYHGPMVVFAKEGEEGVCTVFIIDKFCEGYSLSTPWEKIGGHGSPVYDVFLDNVKVPAENLLGKSGKGFDILLLGIALGKIGTSTVALGNILAAYEEAVKYAKEKMHRGQSIAKFQAIQLKIGHLAAKYASARWMCYRLGSLANKIDNPQQFQAEAALVKGYVSDVAVETAILAVNVHASYGLMSEYPAERIYRDAIIAPHIEGVSDLQRIIYAGSVLR
jgi:alkylation response protein AidB-like acyl-CoA dehydrogenase